MKKRFAAMLFTAAVLLLLPVYVSAEGEETLTVNGVNAMETAEGEGWVFDCDTMTLTLDGYNGGPVIAGYIDLKVVLAEGSRNVITSENGTALGNIQDPFDSPYHTLNIEGELAADGSRPTLQVTGYDHAIYAIGSIGLKNCEITAKSTTESTTTGKMECILSQRYLTVDNCKITVTGAGVGMTCYDKQTISGSELTVDVGMIGIHANNENLVISNSTLDITGGTAALYSYFGSVSLEKCEGTLKAGTAAIYGQNIDEDYLTELTDCTLDMQASYGIMSYADVVVTDGTLTFSGNCGIYAYSTDNTTRLDVLGTAHLDAKACTNAAALVCGTYSCADTASVDGIIRNQATSEMLFSGEVEIARDLTADRPVIILPGAQVTIAEGVAVDFSAPSSVVNQGTLVNNGTLTLNGDTAVNKGTLYNYGTITLTGEAALTNSGEIHTLCSSIFAVEGNAAIVEHRWDDGVVASAPTVNTVGEKVYTCQLDASHTKKEELAKLERADYTAVEEAIAKIPNDLESYREEDVAALLAARDTVEEDLDVSRQDEVDAMAKAIEDALAALQKKPVNPDTGADISVTVWFMLLAGLGGCAAAGRKFRRYGRD